MRRSKVSLLYKNNSQKVFFSFINKLDPMGNTPLMIATILNRSACAKILCYYGANPYFKPFPHCMLVIKYSVVTY